MSGYFWNFYGNALDATNPGSARLAQGTHGDRGEEVGLQPSSRPTSPTPARSRGCGEKIPKSPAPAPTAWAWRRFRAGLGKDTLLWVAAAPFGPAFGIVDEMRIGPDTAPNWTPYLWNMKWATPFIKTENGHSRPAQQRAAHHEP